MMLALLLTAVTGAWATEPTVYESGQTVNQNDLKVGDIILGGVTINGTNEGGYITLIAGRFSLDGNIPDISSEVNHYPITVNADGSWKHPNTTWVFAPIDASGQAGNAWEVTAKTPDENNYDVSIVGIQYDPNALTVEWNPATKTGTFEMPAYDVEIAPIYAPTAVFATDGEPTAIEGIIAGEAKDIVKAGTVAKVGSTENVQGTLMYLVTTTKEQPTSTTGFNATVPTGAVLTGSYAENQTVYVWYYIKGIDAAEGETATAENTFNDSEICGTPLTVNVLSNKFDIQFTAANANTIEAGKATVTVGGTAATVTEGKLEGVKMGSEVKVTAKEGYKFRKVEVKKKAVSKLASEVTTEDIFKVIASDGMIYDNIAAAESAGTVAQGLIVYVGSNTENNTYNHGMALALKDENSNTWGGAKDACNAKNTSTPIVGALWMLPSQGQWNTMFNAVGGCKLRDCFSSAGGNNILKNGNYWSSTGDSEWAKYYMFSEYDDWSGEWGEIQPYYNDSHNVRACIVF